MPENRETLADLKDQGIDRFQDRKVLKYIVLDMDSSVIPTHGDQEASAWSGHFDYSCYHPNFLFNQFGMLERCALRDGNVQVLMAGVIFSTLSSPATLAVTLCADLQPRHLPVLHQAVEADQNRRPCGTSRLRHHLPTARGCGDRSDGLCQPNRDLQTDGPPIYA